ncbi:RNA-binding S4 domain-containing protein [Clostridiaceae bacterium 35-E11]
MRLDKFLKNARIIKRRTIAKEACDQGRVMVNDKVAKAGNEIAVGDVITITFGSKITKLEVLAVTEHVTKDTAREMYHIIQ